MPLLIDPKKFVAGVLVVFFVAAPTAYFFYRLEPAVKGAAVPQVFEVESGEGFEEIVDRLHDLHLIRSSLAFKLLALFTGSANELKPGIYSISPSMSSSEILRLIVQGGRQEVEVRIPEGSSLYDVDELLSNAHVIVPRSLVAATSSASLEGKFFPDTYRFFLNSTPEEATTKFLRNFKEKAEPTLAQDSKGARTDLILASLLEKEVPDGGDRKIVAGILWKRARAGMPLQVDATICYSKEQRAKRGEENCYPLTPLDFKIDSPYNTYLYKGWPPGPIGSPGVSALSAALHPQSSPYWYYLSDPVTKKTIFAKTLEEHNRNKALYLKQ